LTRFSENSKDEDENNLQNTVNDNWNEAVTPWKAVVSHPGYYPHPVSLVIKMIFPHFLENYFAEVKIKKLKTITNHF
jgi:hypothetical protein